MTTTTSLTERYIAATVRSLPPQSQDDVRAELAASIDDDIEARVEQGEDRADAERAVLTALGDPDALAAGYADRPLQLIGPRYYLTWWRLLKLLWAIVPVCAAVGVIIAKAIEQAPPVEIIGTVVSVVLATIVHVAFWTTLVFFILERTGAETGVKWSLDSLPEPQETGAGRGELIAALVFTGLMAGAILWDRFIGFVFAPAGEFSLDGAFASIQILDPGLWPWWIAGLFAIIVLEAMLAVAVYVNRGWTAGFALMNTVLSLAFTVPAIALLANGTLINPELVDFILRRPDVADDVARILAIVIGIGIASVAAWDIFDGWRKAYRAARR
jgi:hypothetical protein